MSKERNRTGDETVIEWLSTDLVYDLVRQDYRVKKLQITGGFGDWRLIITATKEGEALVAFIYSASLVGVARKIHEQFVKDEIKWSPDKYATDV